MAIPSLSQIRFRNAAYIVAFFAAFLISITAVPHKAQAQSSNTYSAEEVVESDTGSSVRHLAVSPAQSKRRSRASDFPMAIFWVKRALVPS